MDNRIIIQEIKAGNQQVIVLLYKEYRDEFIQFAIKNYGLSREELKDVFQDTIIAFYENIASGKLEYLTSDVKTYLFAIGKRQASNHKRNLFKIGNLSTDDDIKAILTDIAAEEMEQPNELEDVVKKVLSELPEQERKILELFYYEKKSMEEIANIMGYANANSMKKKKSLILKKVGEQVIKLSKGLLMLLLWMHMS